MSLMRLVQAAAAVGTALGFSSYQPQMPNGKRVMRNGAAHLGVGHDAPGGFGSLNLFGDAWKAAGNQWTPELCAADSDGDGQSNGLELGDPDCIWQEGDTPARIVDISHPGFNDSRVTVPNPLMTGTFTAYPGYGGSFTVGGTVWIGSVDAGVQVVFASLTGADPDCTETQNGDNNRCGIHIHKGTSCADDTGPHYWDSALVGGSDPWQPITYTDTTAQGVAEVSDSVVHTGFSLAQLAGRAFVVHDSSGARVACALLEPIDNGRTVLEVKSFTKYPRDNVTFEVQGGMEVDQIGDTTQVLRFSMTGADEDCTNDVEITEANGCGIHFHEGTSCEIGTGGHYWNKETLGGSTEADPWRKITYRSDSPNGVTIPINTDLAKVDVLGRVIVIHDKDGARIACGLMEDAEPPTPTPAPGGGSGSPMMAIGIAAIAVIVAIGGGVCYSRSVNREYEEFEDGGNEMQNRS